MNHVPIHEPVRPGSTGQLEHPAARGTRSTVIGMVINCGLAAGKFIAGILGHSYALIADGIESLTDVGSSAVVLIGLRIAMRPPDEDHPYGHGKAEPMAAVAVALALFGAAVVIAVESIHEIRIPHSVPEPWTLAVLAAIVLIKEGLFRYVFRTGSAVGSTAVKTDSWHHRSDAITSGLAFVGISIALLGGNGWESADDWAALLASGLIAFNAVLLLRPAVAELSDAVPSGDLLDRVRAMALRVPGVVAIEKSFIRKLGFDYYLDLHVVVDGALSVREGHAIAHAVKDVVRHSFPRVADVLVHVEPAE
jgi:cation diffusion facilitator family transporter